MSNCKLHPLVRLIDLNEMNPDDMTQYFVVILQGRESRVYTGTTPCDFRDATLLTFLPGECKEYVERMKGGTCKKSACACLGEGADEESVASNIRALCFCGDWLERCLAMAFGEECCLLLSSDCCSEVSTDKRYAWQKRFDFFQYNIKESLHLSCREKAIIDKCLGNIKEEMEWGVDEYSNVLIAQKIKILFDYVCRYYERQHITRSCLNASLMKKIEREVDDYLVSGANCLACCHVPIHRFAEPLGLSDAYFSDFLKRETGKTIDKYVCTRHFEVAKRLLHSSDCSLISIARKLGYHTVQSFSATFKRVLGCSPSEYRNAN